MAYHDELLAHAVALVHMQPQTELTLRRAVSSGYYAVFHLLISVATSHWDNAPLRATLARAFDHGQMRTASNRITDHREFPYTNENPEVVKQLKAVCQGFSQIQEDRHFADYNLTRNLIPTDAMRQVKDAERIFEIISAIKQERIFLEYLTLLLVKKR